MNFNDFFRNIRTPVIVYRDDETQAVAYTNRSAVMYFCPLAIDHSWKNFNSDLAISELLTFSNGDFDSFQKELSNSGEVTDLFTDINIYSGETLSASVFANRVELDGNSYVQIFVYPTRDISSQTHAQALSEMLNLAYKSDSTDEAIQNVLTFAGNYVGVSRSYIFESISEALTSNTYEWCAAGIEPAISELQALPKELYSYDKIIENGLAATDDIRLLSAEDRSILEPQGIKSLALIPIYYQSRSLGYVGFDDCVNSRKWTAEDLVFLKRLADMLASLIVRRDGERILLYSLETLKTVTDNSANVIFVSDLNTDKLIFVNSTFALNAGSAPEVLVGQIARVVFQKWASTTLDFDPLSELIGPDGQLTKPSHVWEFQNPANNKWYLFRCSIIKWIDGRDVHLEVGTEITRQKEYEAQLKHVAATDRMTGLYLRDWGRQLIQQILDNKFTKENNSLVFIDIDELKHTNDTYGHQTGDRLIFKTVELITSHIRKSDTLCRWGGDEFVLILRADENQAESIITKIIARANAYNATGEDNFSVSFSYGIVGITPDSGSTVDSLIAEADEKMYTNKKLLTRNRAVEE